MQAVKINHPTVANKFVSITIILIIFIVVALYVNNAYRAFQPAALPQGAVTISQNVLEEKYGLRVNLIAVTGAGGFIDLRLKIVDGEKARLLLADANNFPVLFTEKGNTLNAPDDTKSQKIEFISGGGLYIMYPNAGNAIQRGKPVTLMFGNTAVESINAN